MHPTGQNDLPKPTILWHILNAAACVGLWLVALMFCVAVIVGLSPESVRQSKLMAVVPFILFVVLNFVAMLLASMRAAKRVAKVPSRHEA
jgi:multisubunit Na+/H+ antiporter MnhE subunit